MGHGQGERLVAAGDLQDAPDEGRLGCLLCSDGRSKQRRIPVIHQNAVLRGESPAAVAASLPAVAYTTNTIPTTISNETISGVWQCSQVVIL